MFSKDTDEGLMRGVASRLETPGSPLYLALIAPQSEVLTDVIAMRDRSLVIAVGITGISLLLTWFCSRLASRPLQDLTREAAAIGSFRFNEPTRVDSVITEIDTLARTMATMKATIGRFIEIGAALASERNFDRLLETLLSEITQVCRARGGVVYLAEADSRMTSALAYWEGQAADFPLKEIGPELQDHPVNKAVTGGAVLVSLDSADLSRWWPALPGREPAEALAVALRNRQGVPVGALMLMLDQAVLRDVRQNEILTLVEALAGTAATAIESQRLYLEQKRLLEAFIELIAGAIDRKSPYTGHHCQRVPELVKMMARAAEAETTGPFKDFALDEDGWQTLHIASWLHDCGKVTTPEFVVDKATKLEAIYDRLHEIRMRFEVLKREAEATCWREIARGAPEAARLDELNAFWQQLDDEFAFVAACNEGGEFMAPEKIERLRAIAARCWTRTLDDRIGLSTEERLRKGDAGRLLPVQEPLLADKPEHVVARPTSEIITADNPWGFKVSVPEHLYNRGELHCLSIGRGTLTDEDRYKINEHIIETIRMLTVLPWPRHLARVIEFAGAHHEKINGTGYPRRLSGDEMSLPARMMAVADIFEALTAADRPYKKAKTLSESIAIMAHMRNDGHIDPEIFDLFLRAQIFVEYGEKYLKPDQIDHVELGRYTAVAAAAA